MIGSRIRQGSISISNLQYLSWKPSMEIRQAHITDVPDIAALVDRFAGRGEILPRPAEDIYQSLREWVVAEHAGQIIGCGALVIIWADLAEIRSLVVVPESQGVGAGRGLVAALMAQAAELGVPQVLALTRQTGFFLKLGFRVVPRESLPRKIWKDCVTCTKFVGCDEVAVVRTMDQVGQLEDWKTGFVERGWKERGQAASSDYPALQPSNLPAIQLRRGDGHE
jgi:amino-acid N-acetyltransferase